MERKFPPTLLIETWLDIANNHCYPEAQEVAFRNLSLSFDDISQAELYVEKQKLQLQRNKVA